MSRLKSQLVGYQVCLKQVVESDLSMLRNWRNDPAVSQYMVSQDFISAEQQRAWFASIQRTNKQQHFVIYYKDQPIGSANIKVNVGESLLAAKTIEPGLYIADSRYRNNIVAFSPTLLLNDYCFDDLGVETLAAVVKGDNLAALNYNKKLGYQVVNQDEFIAIKLNRTDYQRHSQGLKNLLDRSKRQHKT